jgi:putative glutamine amidotransferase
MPIRIAIPEPTGNDAAYNQRALPEYLAALEASGAEPVVVSAHERPERVARMLEAVQGILLPGSPADVDPQRFGESRIAECADPDPARTAVDELLLQDAFNLHKPILGICYGIQNLNVWRNGSLIQHLKTPVNHEPGRAAVEAHPVRIEPGSILAGLLGPGEQDTVQVNSSHHQAVHIPGDNLLVTATSPEDGVIEAVELDSTEHFVIAVQWHPERSYSQSAFSRAIFDAFVHAAETWTPRRIEASVAAQLES